MSPSVDEAVRLPWSYVLCEKRYDGYHRYVRTINNPIHITFSKFLQIFAA